MTKVYAIVIVRVCC